MSDNLYRIDENGTLESIEPDTEIPWCLKHSSMTEDLVFKPTQCYAADAAGAGPEWGPCRIGILSGYFRDRLSVSEYE